MMEGDAHEHQSLKAPCMDDAAKCAISPWGCHPGVTKPKATG